MKKKNIKRRILIVSLITLFAFFVVIMPAFSIVMYSTVFGVRYQTDPSNARSVDEFPGLHRTRYEFASNEGQIVVGYNYYREDQDVKGIIIMAHGIGGGGHNSYMDIADYFTENGYYAFAYDVTGNDESEGSNIRGLPQGVIDLDHCISYVESLDEFSGLPILLFGHSWGGYSVTSVLNEHPEVTAVCSVAGFNRSTDLLEAQGGQMLGPVIKLMMPYLRLYESIKFGDISHQTSMDGFAASDAKVIIFHSANDNTVPITYGYDIYYEEYSDDPDFVFVRYEDLGHNKILSTQTQEAAVAFFDSVLEEA